MFLFTNACQAFIQTHCGLRDKLQCQAGLEFTAHEQREEAAQTEMADQYENKIHSALSVSSGDLLYLTDTLG